MENNMQQVPMQPQEQPMVEPQMVQQQLPMQQPTIDVNAIAAQLGQSLDQRFNDFESRLAEQQTNQPMTPEEIERMNYEIKEKFDNDPQGFINQITQQAEQNAYNRINQEYSPIVQEMQDRNRMMKWNDDIRNYMANNPNANAYMEQMAEIFNQNPGIMGTENPLDTAYKIAAANSIMGGNGDVINNIMNNEQYRNQLLNNENVRNAIISNYQNQLNGNMQGNLPPLMGNNQTGSQIPASTGEQPRNLSESKMAALRRFQGMQ